jgi:hypothetical protein
MTCEWVPLRDGAVAIVCSRSRRLRKCSVAGCENTGRYQCDRRVSGRKSGTCDAWICDVHRVSVGHDIDYCPSHSGGRGEQLSLEITRQDGK